MMKKKPAHWPNLDEDEKVAFSSCHRYGAAVYGV
jgi:hypothetical protein